MQRCFGWSRASNLSALSALKSRVLQGIEFETHWSLIHCFYWWASKVLVPGRGLALELWCRRQKGLCSGFSSCGPSDVENGCFSLLLLPHLWGWGNSSSHPSRPLKFKSFVKCVSLFLKNCYCCLSASDLGANRRSYHPLVPEQWLRDAMYN